MTGLGDIRLYEAIGRMRETADQLQAERDQLKAENARLEQELEAVGTAAYLYGRTDLADENIKLRELLSDYQTCTNRSCPECRYYDECFDGNHVACCIAIDILDKRAKEFGIGVEIKE